MIKQLYSNCEVTNFFLKVNLKITFIHSNFDIMNTAIYLIHPKKQPLKSDSTIKETIKGTIFG